MRYKFTFSGYAYALVSEAFTSVMHWNIVLLYQNDSAFLLRGQISTKRSDIAFPADKASIIEYYLETGQHNFLVFTS